MTIETIPETAKLRDAVAAIERGRKTIAVMVSPEGMLVGTISDGDIRRALLRGQHADSPAADIATRNPVTMKESATSEEIAHTLATHGVEALPIVDEAGRFVRTAFIEEVTSIQGTSSSATNLWGAIIMAGGEGRRMMPHTKNTPKPMLQVGGMPLMERNMRALVRLGVTRFYVSINYLGHIIEDYFGDGNALGIKIEYLRETEPLGTGGAIRLIRERPQGPVLLMNGDLLTGLDVGNLASFHAEQKAHITVAAKEYMVEVPFGVLRVDGQEITSLVEKPSERFLCNAGIYVMAPEVFSHLPNERHFNMTQLIEQAMQAKRKVVAFPMFELWKDVGTPQQLEEARKLVELGEISSG
jgi:dTDP-glucose pyrophosphorylase